MNKRIFSLVCIVLYGLLAVSIHCSEQKHDKCKESGLSRIIRSIKKIKRSNKKIKRSNKKNGIESKREIQLKSNSPEDDSGCSHSTSKMDNKNKTTAPSNGKASSQNPNNETPEESSNNNKPFPKVTLEFEGLQIGITPRSQEHLESLLKKQKELKEKYSKKASE
ncbi:Plasmodium yoelii subtelomeric region (PYST-C1), putative [Plasmodium chabaudi adami]|uniref:Plasmodium yoelii subtelomeric region (PYST-C1), putative n=1 Tax=Plasmodium chabaudi adami TaxID=5826 RepID=A0A1D3L6X6_PLACE|nr:Plasmodium yoelii subtelomeric region (PYST-C1), putative [Plasmodium chabaudi adami]